MTTLRPESEALLESLIAKLELDQDLDIEALLRKEPLHAEEVRSELQRMASIGLLRLPGPLGPVAKRLEEHFEYREPAARDASRGLPNEILDDRFELYEEVGRGGMSRVVRAFDRDLGREIALKLALLPTEESAETRTAWVKRFMTEARITGELEHPGIAPVHEVGVSSDGRVWFAMKLVRGRSLRSILDGLVSGELDLETDYPIRRRVDIALRLCDALAFAHARGIVHGDLKPGNVMVGAFGEVQLMDWGLAHRMGRELPEWAGSVLNSGDSGQTASGGVFGTPSYMSPEQARGELGDVGVTTDVFGLGALCAHLFGGAPPYHGRDLEEVLERAREGRRNDPDLRFCDWRVPRELRAVGSKALAPEIGRRYPSIEELAEDLRAFQEDRRGSAWRDGPVALVRKFVRRRPVLTATVSALLVAAFSVFAVWQSDKALRQERIAKAQTEGALVAESRARVEADRARAEAVKAHRFVRILHEPREMIAAQSADLVDFEADYGAHAKGLIDWLTAVEFDIADTAKFAKSLDDLRESGGTLAEALVESVREVHRELAIALAKGGFAAANLPLDAQTNHLKGLTPDQRARVRAVHQRNQAEYPTLVAAWPQVLANAALIEDTPWQQQAWTHFINHLPLDVLLDPVTGEPAPRNTLEHELKANASFDKLEKVSEGISSSDARWLGRIRGLFGGNHHRDAMERLALAHPGESPLLITAAMLRLFDYGWLLDTARASNSSLLRRLFHGESLARSALALNPDSVTARLEHSKFLHELAETYLQLAKDEETLVKNDRSPVHDPESGKLTSKGRLIQLVAEYRMASLHYFRGQLAHAEFLYLTPGGRERGRPHYARALASYVYSYNQGLDDKARERTGTYGLPTVEEARELAMSLAEEDATTTPGGASRSGLLAEVCFKVGEHLQSAEISETFIEEQPTNHSARLLAIQAYCHHWANSPDYDSAILSKERAMELYAELNGAPELTNKVQLSIGLLDEPHGVLVREE